MTNFGQVSNAGSLNRFRKLFRDRDIFLHDGTSLRRIRIAAPVQVVGLVAFLLLLLWSAIATAQLVGSPAASPADSARIRQMQLQVAAMQADVQALHQVAEQRFQITQHAVRQLGLNPHRIARIGAYNGVGGPLEAATNSDPQFRQIFASWRQLEQLEQGVVAIPAGQPVSGANFTSGYGVRSDPFRGRAAMHGGIDLAGPVGTPIYATADGIVERAEYNNGGYGNLVELSHGPGIQTRYGHLSRMSVRAGERVRRGQVIGLMGSTGRSTGSHLHYEVRIDGRAVNPTPFMQPNTVLASVQQRASAQPAVAQGGPQGGSR
jgi:murein DD-endopeptidase MepM/ murein hydrolase activator NlpD